MRLFAARTARIRRSCSRSRSSLRNYQMLKNQRKIRWSCWKNIN